MLRGMGWWVWLAMAAATIPVIAWAHGDAAWIMNNPTTRYCCTPKDCRALPDGYVVETSSGYLIPSTGQVFPHGSAHIHPSRDSRYWACQDLNSLENKTERCLFIPLSS